MSTTRRIALSLGRASLWPRERVEAEAREEVPPRAIRVHSVGQLILLAALGGCNVLLSLGFLYAHRRGALFLNAAGPLALALLWVVWLRSGFSWLRGQVVALPRETVLVDMSSGEGEQRVKRVS